MFVAGAWVTLTLQNGATPYSGAPSVRMVGDRVEFKGAVQNNSGSTIAVGTEVAVIPTGQGIVFPPRANLFSNGAAYDGSTGSFNITAPFLVDESGHVYLQVPLDFEWAYLFDGASYVVS